MNCARAEELLCDHVEGTLVAPLSSDLEEHLGRCPGCRELRAALAQVVDALRGARAATEAVEPAGDLAERAASAALRAAWTARTAARTAWAWPQSPRAVAAVRGVAAALAVVTTAALYVGPEALTRPARLFDRTVRAGAYLAERKDHLVEDLRLLRVVIATAFEVRLDRVNDRVDDYRRLIERRREPQPSTPLPAGSGPPSSFLNFAGAEAVDAVVTAAAPPGTARRARRTS